VPRFTDFLEEREDPVPRTTQATKQERIRGTKERLKKELRSTYKATMNARASLGKDPNSSERATSVPVSLICLLVFPAHFD
jgi:hypothetical protein